MRPRRSGGASADSTPLQPTWLAFARRFMACVRSSIVLHTLNPSLCEYLESLSGETALPHRRTRRASTLAAASDTGDWLSAELAGVAREVVLSGTHFGIWIDGAGERCFLVDELGERDPHELARPIVEPMQFRRLAANPVGRARCSR